MNFTKIRLIGLSVIDLPVVNAALSDRYILKGADGLGPPEVDVSIADTLNAGGVYQGRRPQSREPVFLIGLNPDYSVGLTASDLRTSLYGMLTPGSIDMVQVEIWNENDIVATTAGYVKKLEISPFSSTPEVQVTLTCLQPYLQAPNDLYLMPSGTKLTPEIINVGTAPSGFRMEVVLTSDMATWSITSANGVDKMELTESLLTGDKLSFDTRPNQRGVWLTRALMTTNFVYALSSDSSWLMLHGGTNVFTTSNSNFNWGDVYYRPQYWGV